MIPLNDFEPVTYSASRFITKLIFCYLRPSDCSWAGARGTIELSPRGVGTVGKGLAQCEASWPSQHLSRDARNPTSQVDNVEWWSRSQSSGEEPAVKLWLCDYPLLVPRSLPPISLMLFSSWRCGSAPGSWRCTASGDLCNLFRGTARPVLICSSLESHQR